MHSLRIGAPCRTRAAALTVCVLAAAASVSCTASGSANHDRTADPISGSIAPFHYLGPVTETTRRAGGNLLLEPPAGATPRLTPTQAYNSWCEACGNQQGTPDMLLARLTTPNSGPARADGSLLRPSINKVLSYVLIWNHAQCHFTGGPVVPNRSTTSASPPAQVTCILTEPIDADTAAPIAGLYYG